MSLFSLVYQSPFSSYNGFFSMSFPFPLSRRRCFSPMARRFLQVAAENPPPPGQSRGGGSSAAMSSSALFFFAGVLVVLVILGKLRDGRMVAVKQLSLEKSQQGESEFLSEVRMITSIQHKNLVRLLGCCSDGEQRLLVYEYMKNRSLDLLVYGNSNQFMDWSTRFQIILGIARGLQYLHEDSPLRIVHRDIKASNVLLDDKYQPRISDFGLARFFPEDQAYLSTTFAGTLGYTAPEYAIRGELSEKADIYSFGVLVLEIICCRKNTDLSLSSEQQYLPEYAWKLYEKNKVSELIDAKLRRHGIVEREVVHVIHVAFLCLQPLANLRPPMSEVVAMLTRKVDAGTTPIKPAFLVDSRRRAAEGSFSWDVISEAFPSPFRSLESHPASSQANSRTQNST
ncbi:Probable LRR receptor-like serine/threonine-protein kinase At1g56140 [Linum grandiflorum]